MTDFPDVIYLHDGQYDITWSEFEEVGGIEYRKVKASAEPGVTTKRLYGAKTKRRTYTVTDEVVKSLGDIGNGNRSKGLRICSGYHGRLVEALETSTLGLEAMIEEGQCGHMFTAVALAADKNRALLTEIAEAGK